MNKSLINSLGIGILVLILSSCLTVEKKEYTFEMKDDNTGTLTIKFINIMSMMDDTTDLSESDFDELIEKYIDGNELESDYENALVRGKRLFEENGELCAEVIIDFTDLESIGLYVYDDKTPYMFNVGSFLDSEAFLESTGKFGGDAMPVVFWPRDYSTLWLSTYITKPSETTISLLEEYKKWQ